MPEEKIEFEAVIYPEEEGGYSVFALNYPEVVSQGETIDEAKANIAEAFLAVLESKRKHGEEMVFFERGMKDFSNICHLVTIKLKG